MNRIAALALAPLLSTAALAQRAATTLAELVRRAEAAAQVAVLDVDADDPAGTRAVVRTVRPLWGSPPERIVLAEPAGRACGRALFGLVRGAGLVVFLVRDRDGHWRAVGTDARCLPSLEPGLVDHALALHNAAGPAARSALLIDGLASASARVREDAALALPALGGLEAIDARTRARVATALRQALGRADDATLALLRAAARLGLTDVAGDLADRYVEAPSHPSAPAVAEALAAIDPEAAGRALDRALAGGPGPDLGRAAELLASLPPEHARAGLLRIACTAPRARAVAAGQALLRGGMPPSELAAATSMTFATACTAGVDGPPRFRAIAPQGGRR
jgi:hypothetical protein